MALTYRNRDVFKTLSEAGINYIRLLAWNNPDRE
jgi:arabinogalactan endo-1,4-beta-galactosidase